MFAVPGRVGIRRRLEDGLWDPFVRVANIQEDDLTLQPLIFDLTNDTCSLGWRPVRGD